MIDSNCLDEKLKLKDLIDTIKYKISFKRENPTYFNADGLVCFTGAQGTGKTLSAVNYVYNLLKEYPKCKLVTNIMLTEYPIVTFEDYVKNHYNKLVQLNFNLLSEIEQVKIYQDYLYINNVFPFNNNDDLMRYNNLDEGVIFLIDEIQLYFNSLESKNINLEVMTQISQQRKQRKHIVCTSQIFGRMAKPLREQFSNVVSCKNYFGLLQINKLVNRDDVETDSDNNMSISGKVSKVSIWFHSPFMYKKYDTYYLIDKNKFISEEEKKGDIYDRNYYSSDKLTN